MPDREKVIDGLEYLVTAYAFHGDDAQCLGGAIDLLKEQEPVEPKISNTAIPVSKTAVRFVKTYWCGACGEAINQSDAYCRKCGKAVKW